MKSLGRSTIAYKDRVHPPSGPQTPAVSNAFRLRVTATQADVDELNHVSNVVYVQWIMDVAKAHSTAVGYDHQAYRTLGSVFVVRRHEIEYLRPCFGGDDIVLVTWIESWRAASSVRRTSIRRGSDNLELASAATRWAFVSFEDMRPTRIPPQLVEAFNPTG